MKKTEILKGMSVLSFVSILFVPINSSIWILFLILGLIAGIVWFIKG